MDFYIDPNILGPASRPGLPAARGPSFAVDPMPLPRPARPTDRVAASVAIERDADPATRVLRQFRLVFNAVKTHFQQVERQAGVGGTQIWALSVIRAQPGIGVSQLARALDVRQPTASNVVRLLVAQGHVQMRREGADRRAVQLYVLPAGARVLRRAPGPFTGVLPQALGELQPEVLARLEQDLAALIGRLATDRRAAGLPLGQM